MCTTIVDLMTEEKWNLLHKENKPQVFSKQEDEDGYTEIVTIISPVREDHPCLTHINIRTMEVTEEGYD